MPSFLKAFQERDGDQRSLFLPREILLMQGSKHLEERGGGGKGSSAELPATPSIHQSHLPLPLQMDECARQQCQ